MVIAWGGLVVGAATLGAAAAVGALDWSSPRNDVVLAGSSMSWLVPVLALSLVAGALAYVTGINGVRLLGAKVASFVGLTEVMFAVVFAWLLVDESLSALQLLGGVLVLSGIALVRVDELRTPATFAGEAPDDVPAPSGRLVAAAPSEG